MAESHQASSEQQNVDQESASAEDYTRFENSTLLYGLDKLKTPHITEFIKNQSVPIEGQEYIRRSPRVNDNEYFYSYYKDVQTVHDMFLRGVKISKDKQCLGWRPGSDQKYVWITYQELYEKVCRTGSGLISKGAETNGSQFIGIFCQNRVEWEVVDRACAGYSMVSVPLYDTLGAHAITHIVNLCELKIIMVDTNARAQILMNNKKNGDTTTVKLIVLIEEPDETTMTLSEETDVEIMTFSQVDELGSKALREFVPPKPDDIYTMCFTSGTTGTPKGVQQSHANAVCGTLAFLSNWSYDKQLTSSDVYLSYLPLAHVLERYQHCGMLTFGGSIGFYQGDPKLLLDDAAALRPTVFPLVPRLINRIYGKILAAVEQSSFKKFIFNTCLNRKMNLLKKGSVTNDTIWDKIIFHKFQALLGGRVTMSVTGAAPVSAEVLNVVRCVMGIPIVEGYGQTETTTAITATLYGDFEGGNVGSVLPACTIKLVDVPEKEYYAKDGKGEVCCKGPDVFKGYYKEEAKTKEAIDEDGWLHTGDIGTWLPNGALKIIDRKKNIFKLSQGEYVAPEKIEQIYTISMPVRQVFVHGESLKSSLVTIVVPDDEMLSQWCREKGVDVKEKTFDDLCGMSKVADLMLEDMNRLGKLHGLKSFELARKIHLSSEAFTLENELLTPTLKSRRHQIAQKYRSTIDSMYEGAD